MKNTKFTKSEHKLIATAEAINKLCTPDNSALPIVPIFAETILELREKLTHTSLQSVKRQEAQSNKEALVADVNEERTALIGHLEDALGQFKVYKRKENDTQLGNMLPNLTKTKLNRQTALDMTTTINTFVSSVEKLDTTKLAKYGITPTWVATLKDKMLNYTTNNKAKNALKSEQPKQTSQFKTVMTDIQDCLTTLTDLVGGYKETAFEFYNDSTAILAPTKKGSKKTSKKKSKKGEDNTGIVA